MTRGLRIIAILKRSPGLTAVQVRNAMLVDRNHETPSLHTIRKVLNQLQAIKKIVAMRSHEGSRFRIYDARLDSMDHDYCVDQSCTNIPDEDDDDFPSPLA